MFSVSFATLPRLLASAAAAGALSLQPISSFAQTAPTSCTVPVLDLANPGPGAMVLPGAYTIQGAAFDPEAAQGSGIDQVSFFLGDRNAGGMALGVAQPDKGPRLDDFSVTVTLPSTSLGEHEFVAYARSALTGNETQVSFPIVLGEDPSKTPLNALGPAAETVSTTSACGATASSAAPAAAPAPAIVVPEPAVATAPSGIAAAEAYAAEVQLQVPDETTASSGEAANGEAATGDAATPVDTTQP
ncbi:MAG TPA: hypothetical protein VKV73_15315 [Chloroflexota bacterium]|nr:hypothetical protein [Chloroflexota bacterium]